MDQRIINLYDSFTHGAMNRRDFLDRLTGLARIMHHACVFFARQANGRAPTFRPAGSV